MSSHHFTLTAAVFVAVGVSGALSAPAQAAPGRCEPGAGVTVVVDYRPIGGGIEIGCDPQGGGKAATQVMSAAGFSAAYTQGQPFVCRINNLPSPADESCTSTPPADAYWGLFHADGTKATWTYSSVGAGSLKVPTGGSIGWRFQDGGARDLPGAQPTVGAAPQPSPTPKPSKTPKPTPSQPGPRASTGPSAAPGPSSSNGATAAQSTPEAPSPTPSTGAGSPGAAPQVQPSKSARTNEPSRAARKKEARLFAEADQGSPDAPGAAPSVDDDALVAAPGGLTPASEPSGGGNNLLLAGAAGLAIVGLAGGATLLSRRNREDAGGW